MSDPTQATEVTPTDAVSRAKDANLIDVLANKAKIYAWCQSLDKGAKRCLESADAGDAETIGEIAVWLRKISAN